MKKIQHRIPEGVEAVRADIYIARVLVLLTRSQVRQRSVRLLVNGREAKLSRSLRQGDLLEFSYSDPTPIAAKPEKIDLDVLYEDGDVIVINKSQGMVVHPGSGNTSGTLVNALLYYCAQLRENFSDEVIRPGIVHRLDRDTSGVIIVAKNSEVHAFLADQFKRRRVHKQYMAIVSGTPPQPCGEVSTRIYRDPRHRQRFATREGTENGKTALTRYRILRRLDGCTLISLRPRTGRTHQLRVHMKSIGCPILSDPIYGRAIPDIPLMLHAFRLGLYLLDGSKTVFKAPLPHRFRSMLNVS